MSHAPNRIYINIMIIFKAVKQTDLKKLETIIKKKIDDVNKVDRNGRTPMHYAALDGNLEVVKLFLKYNAKVNPNDNDGYTPLHYAAINGHLEVVQHIVKHSANVNQINNRVNSPVYYALLKGHIRVVLYLVEQGVDVNLADKWG
jgi:ankyrin repeat protein